jgi:hypothetical protein
MNTTPESHFRQIIDELAKMINQGLARPIYIKVIQGPDYQIVIRQVQFITPELFAQLAHVETRTVYAWIERADTNGLKFYRPPGTRGVLFDLCEAIAWLKGQPDQGIDKDKQLSSRPKIV